ncbi:MAG: hypothetical protein JSU85_13575 [Candidatus Zixiibacteriota bacterium]|nr:MAG: hypothetical protein JSU85_13575 [candidate division Zixibacteria bacterium]
MNWIINIAGFIFALLILVVSHIIDKEKNKLFYRCIVGIIIVFFTLFYWGDFYHTRTENNEKKDMIDSLKVTIKKLYEGQESLKVVIGENKITQDSLNLLTVELAEGQDSLINILSPFIQIARTMYPRFNERQALTALSEQLPFLLKKIEKIDSQTRPCLSFLQEKTISEMDSITGLLRTSYYFRPRVSTLRDIAIEFKFENVIIKAAYIIGPGSAVVFDSGSRLVVHEDLKGLTFRTNELQLNNDIVIFVYSNMSIELLECKINPICGF